MLIQPSVCIIRDLIARSHRLALITKKFNSMRSKQPNYPLRFGGGFGKLGEVCGAFSGICMAAGLLYGYDDPTDKKAKDQHYELIRELGKRFTVVNGSLLCRDLLESNKARPEIFTSEGIKVKECEHIVRSAVQLLDEVIREKNAKIE